MFARILLTLFVFLACGDAFARSRQPQHHSDQVHTQASDNRGTSQTPLVVDVVPAPDAAQRASEERRQTDLQTQINGVGVIIAALVAIFTFAQVYIAARGYFVTRAQLRAYVLVREVSFTLEAEIKSATNAVVSGEFVAKIFGTNSGQTPAKRVSAGARIILASMERAHEIQTEELEGKHQSDWGVGDGPPLTTTRTFDAAEMDKILRGELRVFINGTFDYRDVFGRRHYTRFRYTIDPDAKPQEAYAHSEGNEAT